MPKMSYIEPEVIRLGSIEEHTAALTHGPHDLLGKGNIL